MPDEQLQAQQSNDNQAIVSYEASDGSSVKLTPAIVAKYIVTGGQQVDDREIMSFMAKCQARHLNPLAGDAYMTTYRDKRGNVNSSVIVSKDYFVRTATQQPGFDGMQAGVVVANKQTGQLTYRVGSIVGSHSEELIGGWAEVFDKNRSHPSRVEVSLDEYNQHRSLWNSKPATMIRKVALVQALREAYPGAFGGVYDSSEMPEKQQPQQVEVKVEPQQADLTPIRQRFSAYREARGGINAKEATSELCYYASVNDMHELTEQQVAEVVEAMDGVIENAKKMQPQPTDETPAEPEPAAEQGQDPDMYDTDVEF